jgi:tetratricopeptide (TPR) repeat protein/predicted Ser/Thr protein kinase
MVCPQCGQSTGVAGRCGTCGTLAQGVATGLSPIDTTGLPPGATFGASTTRGTHSGGHVPDGLTSLETDDPTGRVMPARPHALGPLHAGQSFGPRYHIIKMLGIGGMGAVYQAWDAELSVAVALKVIRADRRRGTVTPEAERRFKNELLLARQVTHKHVVRIHDLGEIDGIKYITMPYVQGEDLATTLRRDGKLPRPMAMRLARQLAAGLEAAHDAGVVHRDLKPANVMVSIGDHEPEAQIMDFGISVSSSEISSGGVIGTLEYMAPEQSTGAAVDARADIYAFGLIVYEMLTGPRPLLATSPQARVDAMKLRIDNGVVPPRMVDETISDSLEALILRCLETDADKRFATTRELVAALARLDDDGQPIPEARSLTPRMMAVLAAAIVLLLTGTYFVARQEGQAPVAHAPVSVVIADIENRTGDAAFERTLEPMLRRALEGAGFITAYDRNGIGRTLRVQPPDVLNEGAALTLAANQGLGVVLSGVVERQGAAYTVSLKALQAFDGEVIVSASRRAAGKDGVLEAATRLVADVRTALGDDTSASDPIFRMASLSTTSLDVVKAYAAAQEASSNNRFDEALRHASAAVTLDPKFGIGYQVLAYTSRNLGKPQDAQKYSKMALSYLDGMTDREQYSTRGFYYRVTGDYDECVKEYDQMIRRYAADVVGHNQLALCSTQLRDLPRALGEMRQTVQLVPGLSLFRVNLSYYASYASQFAEAEEVARAIENPDLYALRALALSQVGLNQFDAAGETYQRIRGLSEQGASIAASGVADIAATQGRFGDAARALRRGAATDLAAGNADAAAAKFAALAHTELARGETRAAVAAADDVLRHTSAPTLRFLAGRALIEAGEIERARPIMQELAAALQDEPRAYAMILEGVAALQRGDRRAAIDRLKAANDVLDTWIGRFDLGRAYLAAEQYPHADSEFDRCLKRAGEALSLFLDEEPTYAYFPEVHYYVGRVREALGNARFAESYQRYLAVRGASVDDRLVADARRRAVN